MDSCKKSGTHSHSHKPTKKLVWALVLTAVFAGVEMYSGYEGNAAVLFADAWHMVADSLSMLIAIIIPLLLVKSSLNQSRAEAIAARLICLILSIICVFFFFGIIWKLITQTALNAELLTMVAALGLGVNAFCLFLVHGNGHHGHAHLSTEGVKLHLISDLLSSVVAILAGVVSWYSPKASVGADAIGSLVILIILAIGIRKLWEASGETLQQTESAT